MKRVFLAGEGPNELGGWFDHPSYRKPEKRGVLVALLQKVSAEGWEVVDAVAWKRIVKFQAGRATREPLAAETRNVLGLVLKAREAEADVVAFSRDKDSEKPEGEAREQAVLQGLAAAAERFPDGPQAVGGMAIQRLESWILALTGCSKTEQMRNGAVDQKLGALGVGLKDGAAMVAKVDEADLGKLPDDAVSLRAWLDLARRALG